MKAQSRLDILLHQPIKLRFTKRRVATGLFMMLVFALLACHRVGIPHEEITIDLGNVAWKRSPSHFLSDELWPHPFAKRFKIKGCLFAGLDMGGIPFSISYDRIAKTLEWKSDYIFPQDWLHTAVRHESFAWSGVEDWMLRNITRKAESPETFQRLGDGYYEQYGCHSVRSHVWDTPVIPLH